MKLPLRHNNALSTGIQCITVWIRYPVLFTMWVIHYNIIITTSANILRLEIITIEIYKPFIFIHENLSSNVQHYKQGLHLLLRKILTEKLFC